MSGFKTEVDIYLELTQFRSIADNDTVRCLALFEKAISKIEDVANVFCDACQLLESSCAGSDANSYATIVVLKLSKVFIDQPLSNGQVQSDDLYKNLCRNGHVNYFYANAIDLITASNIAFPGVVGVREYRVVVNGENFITFKFVKYINLLQFLRYDLPRQLDEMNISTLFAYHWLRGIKRNGYDTTSLLGRSVAAFNRLLFSENTEHDDIVWLVMALEALFCHGDSRSITLQLSTNPQLIGSDLSEIDIKNMYEARSAFLHGSDDFGFYPHMPCMPFPVRLDIQPRNKHQKILGFKHLVSAFQLLIEAFRHMIVNGTHELPSLGDSSDESLAAQLHEAASKITFGALYFDKKDKNQARPMLIKDVALTSGKNEPSVIYQEKFGLNLTRTLSLETWLRKMILSNKNTE
ncbi:MAG: hypothetical protein ACHQAX_00165 [Gammaproteobacteria bacterium]